MKTQLLIGWLLIAAAAGSAATEFQTWQLDPETGWRPAADAPGREYHPGLLRVHEAMASGTSRDVIAALEAIKRQYPELAGGDLEAFIRAERAFAGRNLGRAGKLYKDFLDKWPDSIFQPAAMERYFSVGTAFLQGQKRVFLGFLPLPAFDDGVRIMRVISDREGNSPIALRALQVTAENQERRKKFIDAYHTWAEISVRWPTGAEGRDALLRMGRALHASYGGPDYDISGLDGARTYFEDFRLRYPQVAEELNLAGTLATITEQTAFKQFETGFYYERVGNLDAAEMHYQKVLTEWPGSEAARLAAARLEPDAPPAVEPTIRRTLFDAGTGFLDSWFGVKWLFGSNNQAETVSQQ